MFCPECGKKNVENAQFCEHCGAKIAEEVKVNLPKKPRKPVNKKKVIIICILSLVVLILLIGGIILSDNYKPSKVAEDYFVALMNDDTDELYKYIDVDEATELRPISEINKELKQLYKRLDELNAESSNEKLFS